MLRNVETIDIPICGAKGYYRSQVDCIMFTRDEVGFCAVCRRAIDRIIDLYIGK